MSEEKRLWEATPSQASNLAYFIICGLLFWLVIPLFLILWRWLQTKSTKYELSNQRLITRYGVLNKKTDELELYRIKDYQLVTAHSSFELNQEVKKEMELYGWIPYGGASVSHAGMGSSMGGSGSYFQAMVKLKKK